MTESLRSHQPFAPVDKRGGSAGRFLPQVPAVRAFHSPPVAAQVTTLAFVVMPDHVHWLAQLQRGTLSEAVRLYKATVSVALGSRAWQRGFHDRALRRQDDVRAVARYIVANPLRAGLVHDIGDYPHWDASWL